MLAVNISAEVVNSTAILVQWDILRPCNPVSDQMVTFRVQYTAVASGVVQSVDHNGEWNEAKHETTLTGLTPYTNYSIEIAAVDREGDVGPFSVPFEIMTPEYGNYNFVCS